MRNGNVTEYTRRNPDADRLRLVSPLADSSQIPLPQRSLSLQLSGVMSGATYLHDIGVVHGDLKGVTLNDHNLPFYFANLPDRRTFSSMTAVLPDSQTLAS